MPLGRGKVLRVQTPMLRAPYRGCPGGALPFEPLPKRLATILPWKCGVCLNKTALAFFLSLMSTMGLCYKVGWQAREGSTSHLPLLGLGEKELLLQAMKLAKHLLSLPSSQHRRLEGKIAPSQLLHRATS